MEKKVVKMKKIERVNKFGHVAAFLFMAILVFAGLGFLRSYPLISGLSLIAFALFYFVSVWTLRQGCFVYPGVLLFTTGYYLLFFYLGIGGEYYPVLSIPIVLGILFFERSLRKKTEDLAHSIERSRGLVILFFTLFILFNLPVYLSGNLVRVFVPLLAFSLVCLFHYLETKKLFSQISCLILFSGVYLLILYWIKCIPRPYYGLFLIALGIVMMALGNYYHSRAGFKQVWPLYMISQVLSFVAFIYAARNPTALLVCLTIFSIHYSGFSRSLSIKPTAWRYPELMFYKYCFGLANLAAVVYIILLLSWWFKPAFAILLTALGYIYIYGQIAYHRTRTILKTRSQYVYLAGLFLTVFYLVLLQTLDPLRQLVKNMFLVVPFVAAILYNGYIMEKAKKEILSISVYETAITITGISLFLPSIAGEPATVLGIILGVCFLPCFFIFCKISGNQRIVYAFPVIFSYLYYHILNMAAVPGPMISLCLIPAGAAGLISALFRQRKPGSLSGPFHFAWVFLAGISLTVSGQDPNIRVYLVAFWAACFLIVSQSVPGKISPVIHKPA